MLKVVILLCILSLNCPCISSEQLLMQVNNVSPEGQPKSGPVWPWPMSPSWLYLLLPLIMSSIYLRMKYDLHRYVRKQHDDQKPHVPAHPASTSVQHPGLALMNLQDISKRIHDPEMEAIAHWLGRELSVEEWGRVPLSRMTKRQLQALGFVPGCPILTSPQFEGMTAHDIGQTLGITDRAIAGHAESHKMPVLGTNKIRWSDPSRFEEISN